MFYARESESRTLQKAISTPGSAVLLYGKHRVGKTTLILQALRIIDVPFVYFECTTGSLRSNLDALCEGLLRSGLLDPGVRFDSLDGLFRYLDGPKKHIVIAIEHNGSTISSKPNTIAIPSTPLPSIRKSSRSASFKTSP